MLKSKPTNQLKKKLNAKVSSGIINMIFPKQMEVFQFKVLSPFWADEL